VKKTEKLICICCVLGILLSLLPYGCSEKADVDMQGDLADKAEMGSRDFNDIYGHLQSEHADELDCLGKALRCLVALDAARIERIVDDAGEKQSAEDKFLALDTNALVTVLGITPARVQSRKDDVSVYLCDYTTYCLVLHIYPRKSTNSKNEYYTNEFNFKKKLSDRVWIVAEGW
jgi:hypothetical protein